MRGVVEVEGVVADVLVELVEFGIGVVDAAELDDAGTHVGGELVCREGGVRRRQWRTCRAAGRTVRGGRAQAEACAW